MIDELDVKATVDVVREQFHRFEVFMGTVAAVFKRAPSLNGRPPILHSLKRRIKDLDHLEAKLRRKHTSEKPITRDNIFSRVADIAGVRVLHLYQQDFSAVDACIREQVQRGDWALDERAKAYTWDPESREFLERHDVAVEVKESFYTSIHYVVRPRPDAEVSCEIQVRTLFEEIWGEIDHQLNYPTPAASMACREQIRVLARIVGAGSRLADAIYRVSREAG